MYHFQTVCVSGFRVLKTLLSINADDGNYVIVKACKYYNSSDKRPTKV